MYRWDGYEAGRGEQHAPDGARTSWWSPPLYHSRRTENLVDALNNLGASAVLSADPPLAAKRICVYPDLIEAAALIGSSDPIMNSRRTAEKAVVMFETCDSVVASPPYRWKDLLDFMVFHIPVTIDDLRELAARVWPKILRLIRGQH